jgi:homoserine acetyltransferase
MVEWGARLPADSVQASMLVIVVSSDHVVTPAPAIEYAEYLGDRATLVVFENDCGHDIPGCEMFRSRAVIREFLRQD